MNTNNSDIPAKKTHKNKKFRNKNYAPKDKMTPKAQIRFVLIFNTIALIFIGIAIRAIYNQKIAMPYLGRHVPWHEFTGLSLFFPVSILLLFAACLISLAVLTARYNIKYDSSLYRKICFYSFITGVFLHQVSLFFGVSLK